MSITPDQKYGRAYYMGTVHLKDVKFRIHKSGISRAQREQARNVHAWAVGDVIHEALEQNQPSKEILSKFRKITYHYNIGRFVSVDDGTDVTDGEFSAAIFVGRDFYISNWQ